MEIRTLRRGDLRIGSLFYETLALLSPTTLLTEVQMDALADRLKSQDKVFVADEGGQAVGTCTVWIKTRIAGGFERVALIEDVAVHPDHQGKGIAHALIKHAISYARTCGVRKARLVCNCKVVKVYKRVGFEVDGVSMSSVLTSPESS